MIYYIPVFIDPKSFVSQAQYVYKGLSLSSTRPTNHLPHSNSLHRLVGSSLPKTKRFKSGKRISLFFSRVKFQCTCPGSIFILTKCLENLKLFTKEQRKKNQLQKKLKNSILNLQQLTHVNWSKLSKLVNLCYFLRKKLEKAAMYGKTFTMYLNYPCHRTPIFYDRKLTYVLV